jgi:hypothetical protein
MAEPPPRTGRDAVMMATEPRSIGAVTQAGARDRQPSTPVAPPAASTQQPQRPHLYDPSMQGITANSDAAKSGVSNRPK